MTRMRASVMVVAFLSATFGLLTAPPSDAGSAHAATATAGHFVPMAFTALLDTRTGTGAARAKIPANGSVTFQVTGRAGIPSTGVAAAFVTIEAVNPSRSGSLKTTPAGRTASVSSLSFTANRTASNTDTIEVSSDGKITLTNASDGTVDAAVSTSGYYLTDNASVTGHTYSPVPADGYLYDTERGDNWGIPGNKLGANSSAAFGVAGHAGVPASGATAVAVNITVKDQTADGWVSLFPVLSADPNVSALDYTATGGPGSGFQIVPLNPNGLLAFTNHGTSPINASISVRGYFTADSDGPDGLDFTRVTPQTIVDTAKGTGVGGTAPLAAGQSLTFDSSRLAATPDAVAAAALTITTRGAEQGGWLSVYPADSSDTNLPSVAFPTGAGSSSGSDTVVTSGDQKITLTNHSSGAVHVQVAVSGYFVSDDTPIVGAPATAEDPTTGAPDAPPDMPTTVPTDDSDPDDASSDLNSPTVSAGIDDSTAAASPSATSSALQARWTSWCVYSATKPFALTHTSRTIWAEGKKKSCGGSAGPPDKCHAGVDLQAWNLTGDHQWHVIAHNGGKWTKCKGKVQAAYRNCHYQPRYKVWYRSAVWLQIEKRGLYGTPGWAYSKTNYFYCD
ncbi:hypothetical protein [Sphaerisporangium fuscum]|uniref:hypothetical protein n=1 Tax=Sphaerisporangium fuscum TaxID=2835868 RepID=UPI001BDD07CD|nr:hypothetical protein [Sphaerisporangium fuscum]